VNRLTQQIVAAREADAAEAAKVVWIDGVLSEYARETARDAGLAFSEAVRFMSLVPNTVHSDTGITEARIKEWCHVQLGYTPTGGDE